MAGPWEDYKPQAAAAQADGPWSDYQPAKAKAAPEAAPEMSIPDRAMRAVGLAGRAAAPIVAGATAGAVGGSLLGPVGAVAGGMAGGGAAALAPVLADVVNWIRGGGKDTPSERLEQVLDKAFPKPASASERVVYDVNRALAGTGGTVAAGRLLADTAQSALGRKTAALIASNPEAQALAAAGGSAAGGMVRESGGGPGAQIAAGIAGSYAAPAVVGTAKAAGRLTKAILDTTGLRGDAGTEAAVQRILADALGSPKVLGMGAADDIAGASVGSMTTAGTTPGTVAGMVRDPKAVARSLENVTEFVPGSRPTTAQASGSTELAILERALAAANPKFQGMLDERMALNNLARQQELRRLAGGAEIVTGPNAGMTPGMVSAEAKRTAVTAPLREGALSAAQANGGVPTMQLERQISDMLALPGIRSSDVAAGALGDILAKVQKFGQKAVIDPADLYTIRKEIGNTIQKFAQENQNFDKRYTAGLASQVQAMMDDAIEQAGGAGWKEYLSKYSRMSRPIEQMETVAGIRKGAENARVLPIPGTEEAEYALSQAKFKNLFTNKRGELAETLTPAQMKRLENVAADLDRGSLSATSGRGPGSNTAQNLSTAYVLGQVLGNDAQAIGKMPGVSRFLNFITKLNENDVQDMMARIMLDPKMAKTMLEKATPRTVESLLFEIEKSAKASGIGSAQSAAQTKKGQ